MATTIRPGAPIWIDLSTSDTEAAKKFYGELFGWEFADTGEEFGHYQIISCNGAPVGGAMSSEMGDGTAPTAWGVYLRTNDSATTVQAVKDNGGQVLVNAMPVGDLGTMAIYLDPSGAAIGSWEVDQFGGFELPLTPGTPRWFELMSTDYDKAAPFYQRVFGWELTPMGGTDGQAFRYDTFGAGDDAVCGICDAAPFLPAGMPSFWRMYLGVVDTDQAVARINELGGRLLDGPEDTPFGRIATVADPQGAMFQIGQDPTDQG
ncbi:VOC family protein [Naumannella sp. ID2617S]|nr:VOC family protein [Naumannella sp. ID2617S]